MRDLSLIIVNYRHPEETGACLASLESAAPDCSYQVVVVNSGKEGAFSPRGAVSADNILDLDENRGYAAAVNAGIAVADGEFLLPMNADILFREDCLTPLLQRMQKEPKIGVLLPRLINPDGSDQYNARRFYTPLTVLARRTPLGLFFPHTLARHLMLDQDRNRSFSADWGMGAALLTRREMLESGHLYDDRFFLYFEDVDLCARTWQRGLRVELLPGARLVHTHRRESAGLPWCRQSRHHLTSLYRFWRKHGTLRPTGAASVGCSWVPA